MRKDVRQSLFGRIDISSSKHKETIECICQANILSSSLDHLDISPPVFLDAPSCVDANLGADLDSDYLTRSADRMN